MAYHDDTTRSGTVSKDRTHTKGTHRGDPEDGAHRRNTRGVSEEDWKGHGRPMCEERRGRITLYYVEVVQAAKDIKGEGREPRHHFADFIFIKSRHMIRRQKK